MSANSDDTTRIADLQTQVSALKLIIKAMLIGLAEHDEALAWVVYGKIPSRLQEADTAGMELPPEPVSVELEDLLEEFETVLGG